MMKRSGESLEIKRERNRCVNAGAEGADRVYRNAYSVLLI